jgi:hypothetical protein
MSYDWGDLESEAELPPDAGMTARRLGDRINRIGASMLAGCIAVLVVGRVLALLLFPEWVGRGLTPLALTILIPVWVVGIGGLVLLLVGAIIRWRGKRMRGRKS